MTRESQGLTGIGDGIAIPHVRNPILLHIQQPMVTLCFLENPIHFAALDGQPVNTLFTLVSPTIRAHLGLLSRLAFALRDDRFKQAVTNRGSCQELLDAAARVERQVAVSNPKFSEEHAVPSPKMKHT